MMIFKIVAAELGPTHVRYQILIASIVCAVFAFNNLTRARREMIVVA